MRWRNWSPLTPTLSHQGRGSDVVGELVAPHPGPLPQRGEGVRAFGKWLYRYGLRPQTVERHVENLRLFSEILL